MVITIKTKNKFTTFAGIIANKYAMIERELYMKQIRSFMNRPFIKVIAGIRRCGKSVVLQLIAEELERQGVAKEYCRCKSPISVYQG